MQVESGIIFTLFVIIYYLSERTSSSKTQAESPTNSPIITTSTAITPPPAPSSAAPKKHTNQSLKSPSQQTRHRARSTNISIKCTDSPNENTRSYAIGELIWGPARGYPAWPGKIVRMPEGACSTTQQYETVWVQWFGSGGRANSELVAISSLQSLSEGLEAHHKAQKDTRK